MKPVPELPEEDLEYLEENVEEDIDTDPFIPLWSIIRYKKRYEEIKGFSCCNNNNNNNNNNLKKKNIFFM